MASLLLIIVTLIATPMLIWLSTLHLLKLAGSLRVVASLVISVAAILGIIWIDARFYSDDGNKIVGLDIYTLIGFVGGLISLAVIGALESWFARRRT